MTAFRLDPKLTQIDRSAFVASTAVVLGDVVVGADVSVWFGAVIRGDVESIRIGARTNLQDNCVVHADPGHPALLGDNVTVGHRAIVHGATVHDGAMIGMGATLLNGAVIGEQALVGAGALVPGGKVIPPRTLALGSPAKVIRELTEEEVAGLAMSAQHYVDAGKAFEAAGHGSSAKG